MWDLAEVIARLESQRQAGSNGVKKAPMPDFLKRRGRSTKESDHEPGDRGEKLAAFATRPYGVQFPCGILHLRAGWAMGRVATARTLTANERKGGEI